MLDLEEQNMRTLGDNEMHYLSYPPPLAVDGKTRYCIPQPSEYIHCFSFEDTFLSVE